MAENRKYIIHPWKTQESLHSTPLITGGKGVYFFDRDGRKYIDMSSQLVNMNLGHGNREIIDAIKEQAEKLPYIAPNFMHEPVNELSRLIIEEIMPDNMGKLFFTLGGADANEHAIKIARKYTGRQIIMSRYRSYHGSTMGAASLTGEPRGRAECPQATGFVKFHDPCLFRSRFSYASEMEASAHYLEMLEEQIIHEGPERVAAVFIETITGTNGVIIPPEGYLEGLRGICDRYGILLVCDEVMTGWCRTGKWFAFEHWKIKPDIVTFAKGITCGYVPLGGICIDKRIADFFENNSFPSGLTYGAHPIGCAAGIAAIKAYRKHSILENVGEMEKILSDALLRLREKHECVGDVRLKGLLGMIELVSDKKSGKPLVPYNCGTSDIMKQITSRLFSEGFYTYSHDNMLSVSPPLIISSDEIALGIKILDKILGWVDRNYLS